MITFITLETTNKVLRIINDCIKTMIEMELSYYDLIKNDEEEQIEYLMDFFPKHLCREETKKCVNTLQELLEWTKDSYLHDLTCIHEYALYKIFISYFNGKEDYEVNRKKGEKNIYKFHVKDIENYEPDEIYILKMINDEDFYTENLFWDLDFLYLDEIVNLYQTNRKKFDSLGVNLRYYLDIMPKDIKEEIKFSLDNEKKEDETEAFVIKQISNVIKQMEMNPVRLEKCKENEISDDIKDRMQFALEMKNINIEREARGGFAQKEIGEIDFFLYTNDNHRYIQLAVGENKVWGSFEKQLEQLLGYSNKNIKFGFTIVINENDIYQKIKDSQKEILEKFNLNGKFQAIKVEEREDVVVSTHTIPEENKIFKIYHFIINKNGQERKEIANKARGKDSSESKIEKDTNENIVIKETVNDILDKIEKQVTFDDMMNILDRMKEIIYEDEADELIKRFKEIGANKRKNAKIVVEDKKYNNIQVFDEKDAPIMAFCEKIRNQRDKTSIYMRIYETIEQYKDFDHDNKYVIKKKYIKEAIEIVQKKYKALDLLENKKIDIFITNKGKGDLRSYMYKDGQNKKFQIFIYTDKDAVFTTLYQLGLIVDMILINPDEVIPKNFIKINKKIKVDLLKATKEERILMFAEIFAITALSNTHLEDFAPFKLGNNENKILENYFIEEIEKNKNKKDDYILSTIL